jgi:carboxypeptidase T
MMRLALVAAVLLPLQAHASPDAFDGGSKSALPAADTVAPAPAAQAKGSGTDDRLWITVEAADRVARGAVADAGVSIEEITPETVSGIATTAAAAKLRAAGARFTAQALDQRFRVQDFPAEDAAFHDYARTAAELRRLAAQAPELASLFSIGKSLQGRDIWALRLNEGAQGSAPSAKPGVLFLGTHHAREHLSTEVPLLLAKHLIDHRADADLAPLLAKRDIYIVPMVNPDGVEHDIAGGQYHMHRKNMRPGPGGALGVDLNRNYGWHFGEAGASANPKDETYHGPSAFSEPETQAVKAFVESRENLKVLLSYHTYSELILYPWGYADLPIDDARALSAYKKMAETMAGWTGYTAEQSSDLYAASGDLTDWSWGARHVFSFTFELTPKSMWDGGFYPGASAIAGTFAANIKPALYLIDLADDPYRAADAAVSGGAR